MPKAASAAASQGKVCAAVIVARLAGHERAEPSLDNVCYSLAGPDWGFVEINKYRPENGQLLAAPDGLKTSPLHADAALRMKEAREDETTFRALTTETFA